MRKSHGAWLGALPLLLAGCGAPEAAPSAPAATQPLYFDVKGLLDQQIKQLGQAHTATLKRVSVRGSVPETVRVPAVKWADELQLFFQADINKAALRGVYAVDSARLPDGRLRRTYTRLPGHDIAPVGRLSVLSAGAAPEEITADVDQQNALFSARKHLRLDLRQGLLTAYAVQGTQKLVLFDTLRYAAAGQVQR
ncbi:hypothetical protein [Hymenobacter sp. PAMC 26628]|uniref:hypothetical protein n=1 Tax=Hymenobacter sp. PAMC 26628 TaxID=1484118 RepID=UPI00077045FC|nr:hypothetical protein [Hymenobacter sp. PAMC 26628]AMJ67712.1 hypothetical protein AXW84_21540 [Hymenobacter sp. PAMC 26628]